MYTFHNLYWYYLVINSYIFHKLTAYIKWLNKIHDQMLCIIIHVYHIYLCSISGTVILESEIESPYLGNLSHYITSIIHVYIFVIYNGYCQSREVIREYFVMLVISLYYVSVNDISQVCKKWVCAVFCRMKV